LRQRSVPKGCNKADDGDPEEVSELDSILLAKKQELETKLDKERQAKDAEHPIDFFIFVIKSCPSEL
jgi:hypothetical protein